MSAVPDRINEAADAGYVCTHLASPCPSVLHHERRLWREADRWALGVVEGEDDDGRGFAESSLSEAPDLPEPRYFDLGDGNRIVRPGDIVFLHGMNAAGKSPTLDMLGREHLEADPDTLWLLMDYELGASRQRERLLRAGFTEQQIAESIYYVQFPPLLTDRAKDTLVKGVLDKAERFGKVPRLLTWDTFARSCSRMPGADPEKNAHINDWFTTHVDWAKSIFEGFTQQPLTQYVTDHPNKDDGSEPGGGHAKQDRVVINLWLRRGAAFSAGHEHGRSTFHVSKFAHAETRFARGDDIAALRNRIGPDGVSRFYRESLLSEVGHTVAVNLTKAGRDPAEDIERKILQALREAREGGLSRTNLTGDGGGATPYRQVLDRLVSEGLVVQRDKPGTRGKVYWLPALAP